MLDGVVDGGGDGRDVGLAPAFQEEVCEERGIAYCVRGADQDQPVQL